MSINRHEVTWYEVNVDVYESDRPKSFEAYCDGDMDSDNLTGDIVIKLPELPPGARVSVKYPCCPECGDVRADNLCSREVVGHATECECGFDWVNWENDHFS